MRYSASMSHSNRLSSETSPYLLQHADNPVDWYPWGEEALALAREQDKPILLSVGYSACHWCHVMAHESFEDETTAELMNQLYVNIKVDREERPDLDRIYQTAHQLLTHRPGGWPLTMFIDPDDQRPFFGGTYFPPESRHGLPSFRELLARAADFYKQNRDDVKGQGEQLAGVFTRLEPGPGEHAITDAPLGAAREAV
ncbi:MAG: thioredoxin domain-containing protein, partial [Gammaproteobacteria bacterium]|nr:thioredoxin domain-containing protein [Gammaproteobacteria bacterium]